MLSLRERECLRLVHQGLNSKEIGQALKLSPHTVDHHLRHSIRKLSSRDRRAAARALAARESDDPIVRDWLRQTLSLVSAAGLVMDELAEASTSHGPDEHHRVEHGRLPAEVEVERPGSDTGGDPAGLSAAADAAPPLHTEGGRAGFVFRGSAVGYPGGDPPGHQQAHVSVASGVSRQRELTLFEKTAAIIGTAITLLMVLRVLMPPVVSYLHALHAAGFI
jgi:DNA-binding CsgD family transcriptional regulator